MASPEYVRAKDAALQPHRLDRYDALMEAEHDRARRARHDRAGRSNVRRSFSVRALSQATIAHRPLEAA